MAAGGLAVFLTARPIALWLAVICVANGAFVEAWSASAWLSAELSSVPGFKAGKGGAGIIAGGGVSISVRWMVVGGGAGGSCTTTETQ